MLNSTTHVANASIYRSLPYDTLRDFTPIALVAGTPTIMVVHPSVAASSMQEFITLAKMQPGRIDYGSAGNGSGQHMAAAWFAKVADIGLVHVPYKGGAAAVIGLLGGEVQLLAATVPTVINQVKAGKLRALAVTSAQRSLLLPALPTVAESGVPGYDMNAWIGIFGPAGMPLPIVMRLHGEFEHVLTVTDVRDSLLSQGIELASTTQPQFASFVKNELAKYFNIIKIIKESGTRFD